MNISFTLSMPGSPSWNGRWSGEGRLYARVKSFTGKKAVAKAQELLAKGHFSYGWSDGWRASISVKEVTPAEKRAITKRTVGFCGYDWMIDSILQHGFIATSQDLDPKAEPTMEDIL